MNAHSSKFDEHIIKGLRNEPSGLAKDAGIQSTKVMDGKNSYRAEVSASSKLLLDKQWESIVETETGYASYEELRAEVNKELGRSFGTHKGL